MKHKLQRILWRGRQCMRHLPECRRRRTRNLAERRGRLCDLRLSDGWGEGGADPPEQLV